VNIFYLDKDPKTCAEMHNDKHCVKMILEYAQLLSTAHRVLDGEQSPWFTTAAGRKKREWMLYDDRQNILYAATHLNHPSAIWVRQSIPNYIWLAELLEMLCIEYTYRYGKIHKVESSGLMQTLKNRFPENIPSGKWSEPTPAMPDDVKVEHDSISSYRNYYIKNKTHLAKWKNRNVPEWFNANI
jgi:hypothetical protein